jgi:hypothetical protein
MNLLKHPILAALGFEAALIAIFMLFPVGACNAPAPGVAVLALHAPGLLLSSIVFGPGSNGLHLVVAPIVMSAFWISALYLVRNFIRTRNEMEEFP